MRTLYTIEPANPGVRKATTIAQGPGDINRVSVCYNGIQGYINRSGAILCRSIEAKKVLNHKAEISKLMRELFGTAFKVLYIGSNPDAFDSVQEPEYCQETYTCPNTGLTMGMDGEIIED